MGLIALSGKIGSGKDTFCSMLKAAIATDKIVPLAWKDHLKKEPWNVKDNVLETFSGYQTKRWAGALKQIVAILIGCTVEQLEDREFKETPLGPEWDIEADYGKYDWLNERMTLTPRIVFQLLGTNCVRNIIHPNSWVNALISQYDRTGCKSYCAKMTLEDPGNVCEPYQCPRHENWIIPDTRFPNEADAIKQRNGLVFRVERDGIYSNYCQFIKSGKGDYSDLNSNQDCMSYDLFYRQDLKFRNRFLNTVPNHESETALDSFNQFDEVITNNGTLEELYDKAKQIVQKYQLHK